MGYGYAMLTYDPEDILDDLGDIAACSYDGAEIGLPEVRNLGPDRLRDERAEHDPDVYYVRSGWRLEGDDAEDAVDGASVAARRGSEFLGILPPPRGQVNDTTPERRLDDICTAADADVVHHHGVTYIEQPNEIRAWVDRGPDNLQLQFDTAHYCPYGDAHSRIRRFGDDIAHVALSFSTSAGAVLSQERGGRLFGCSMAEIDRLDGDSDWTDKGFVERKRTPERLIEVGIQLQLPILSF